MHFARKGTGRPLLLIHGLGGSIASWDTVADALAEERELVIVDLPGFGESPPLAAAPSIAALADALGAFLEEHELQGVDVVGSSMGARLALELARRRQVGATVALDPGGFWTPKERRVFGLSVSLSVKLVRLLEPLLPRLIANPVTRTLLFAQFSARPWALPADVALNELQSFVGSDSFDSALRELVRAPTQAGIDEADQRGPIVIGWGRRDWVTLPRQAPRATRRFPGARLHWFEGSGHFPHWDSPEETVSVVLGATGAR